MCDKIGRNTEEGLTKSSKKLLGILKQKKTRHITSASTKPPRRLYLFLMQKTLSKFNSQKSSFFHCFSLHFLPYNNNSKKNNIKENYKNNDKNEPNTGYRENSFKLSVQYYLNDKKRKIEK